MKDVGNLPTTIELPIGGEYSVELPGLGTAGYIWTHEIDGPTDVVDIEWRRGVPPDAVRRPIGQSAPEIAKIRARATGRVTLNLTQRRPWERDSAPIASHAIEVIVRSPQ